MLFEHSTPEELEGFLRAPSGPGRAGRNARILSHLAADCRYCRENLETATLRTRSYDYGAAFAAAEQALADLFAAGRVQEATPEELLAELEPLAADEQTHRVQTDRRYAHPGLVRRLIDASHSTRYQDTGRMLRLAELARHTAEACTVEDAGSAAKLADLRAQGWRQYGNALRIRGRMREAEEAFSLAQRHASEGTGDPPLRASLFEQMASLRYFQRRFDESIELAESAGQIYRELGETQSLASTLVQKAIASLYAGEAESAVRILNSAIPMLDPEADANLLLAACHNLVRCYIDLGRPEQALSIYFEIRDLYRRATDPLIRLRVSWQEGQLLRDLGHLRAAESVLLQARQGFVERELLYEAAQVSLDIAAVYVRLRAEEELRQTVSETVPIFRALGVDREVLASLLQLQQLAHQGRQALELIRLLNGRLEQLAPCQTGRR